MHRRLERFGIPVATGIGARTYHFIVIHQERSPAPPRAVARNTQ